MRRRVRPVPLAHIEKEALEAIYAGLDYMPTTTPLRPGQFPEKVLEAIIDRAVLTPDAWQHVVRKEATRLVEEATRLGLVPTAYPLLVRESYDVKRDGRLVHLSVVLTR